MIAVVAIAHFRFKLNGVLAFWIAYILTRPLGASLGDYLSQPRNAGGLSLGTVVTSALFLSAIVAVVLFLTITRKDETPVQEVSSDELQPHLHLPHPHHMPHPHMPHPHMPHPHLPHVRVPDVAPRKPAGEQT
jgi:hypothetical protein